MTLLVTVSHSQTTRKRVAERVDPAHPIYDPITKSSINLVCAEDKIERDEVSKLCQLVKTSLAAAGAPVMDGDIERN